MLWRAGCALGALCLLLELLVGRVAGAVPGKRRPRAGGASDHGGQVELVFDPEDQEGPSPPAPRLPAPASAPSPPPAPPASGDEVIGDPDDAAPAARPAATPAGVAAAPGVAAGAEPSVVFSARAGLKLAFDLYQERPTPGSYRGYLEDVMELDGIAAVRLELRARPWLRFKLGGNLLYRLTQRAPSETGFNDYRVYNGRLNRNEVEASLSELSASASLSVLDLQLGVLSAVWGATDLTNPNDVLTARDLRSGPLVDLELGRLPVLTFKAEVQLAGFSLAGFWQPLFVPHKVDMFGSDYAVCGPVAPPALQRLGELAHQAVDDSVEAGLQSALQQTRSPSAWKDSTLGVRVSRSVGGFDLALQYAWTFERQPVLRLRPDGPVLALVEREPRQLSDEELAGLGRWLLQDPSPVESSYRRFHHLGASLSGTLGPLALALDLAYQSRASLLLGGQTPLVPDGKDWYSAAVASRVAAYSIGLSYTRGERLVVMLEWWHRILLDLAGRAPADRPELLLGGPQYGGLALLARYRFSFPLTLQVVAHSDLLNPSLVVSPQASFRFGDHLSLAAGAHLFEGTIQSVAGRLGQNDMVYVGLEGFL
jgi:hypothetical protein